MIEKLFARARYYFQLPLYTYWKSKVIGHINANPSLISYLMLAWLELEADEYFKEHGFDATVKKAQAKLDEIAKGFEKAIETAVLCYTGPEARLRAFLGIPDGYDLAVNGEFPGGKSMLYRRPGESQTHPCKALAANVVGLDTGVIISNPDPQKIVIFRRTE